MDAFMAHCIRDFYMEGGNAIAFRNGTFYKWRWATTEEQKQFQCDFVFESELGSDHFMNHDDVELVFGAIRAS